MPSTPGLRDTLFHTLHQLPLLLLPLHHHSSIRSTGPFPRDCCEYISLSFINSFHFINIGFIVVFTTIVFFSQGELDLFYTAPAEAPLSHTW
jgi:hypothetical protein